MDSRDNSGQFWILDNEKFRALPRSCSILRVVKPRRLRLAGNAARLGQTSNAYKSLVGNNLEKTAGHLKTEKEVRG